MRTDGTGAIVLVAVASVGAGVWLLWKGKAWDVLVAVGSAEGLLAAGVALEALFPGGFAISVAAAGVVGMRRIGRIGAAREAELDRVLAEAADAPSRLLALHDRLDEVRTEVTGVQRAVLLLSIGITALTAIGLIVMGLTYDVWEVLLAGIGLSFLPVSQAVKGATSAEERKRIEARIGPAETRPDLLASDPP